MTIKDFPGIITLCAVTGAVNVVAVISNLKFNGECPKIYPQNNRYGVCGRQKSHVGLTKEYRRFWKLELNKLRDQTLIILQKTAPHKMHIRNRALKSLQKRLKEGLHNAER
ncbi:hypothetical protein T4C_10061 [Trichinella pseudospiralis]|uniref:Uncharacterized protein n=1 Tax=Trichinella pseudospiralis TaxID=6337 RepID=A0A0V1JVB1_TRIPS|nr:hypothetical protein T4C_10061 [Trichinella pseudospiralis]